MNKYALEILEYAYNQYQKSGSTHCSVQFTGSANDIVGFRNAIRNLQSDSFIENADIKGLSASFDLSALGIEYMRHNGEL